MSAITLFTHNVTQHKVGGCLLVFLLGASTGFIAQAYTATGLANAAIYGILFTLIYLTLFRRDQTSIIMFVATRVALGILFAGIAQSYPGAIIQSLIASTLIFMGSYWWFSSLRKIARS
jgi:hypothetical protein